jgi:putative endonuclease
MSSMPGYVYILKSLRNDRFYIGSTNDLERRLVEHSSGRGCLTTKRLRPLELVFKQKFETVKLAKQIETKLKQLKNRQLLEIIIDKGKLFLSDKNTINW